MEAQN